MGFNFGLLVFVLVQISCTEKGKTMRLAETKEIKL
jgi:hypothetical protein